VRFSPATPTQTEQFGSFPKRFSGHFNVLPLIRYPTCHSTGARERKCSI